MDYEQHREMKRKAEAALDPMRQWSKRCHEASVALVRSGAFPGARVARGVCNGVGGQHSWVVLGDPYDQKATILDPTLWSYTGVASEVYVGDCKKWRHRPFGTGNIFEWGRPPEPTGKVVKLTPPKGGWSEAAHHFLMVLGPLDLEGWAVLAHAPVQGWPAKEILGQIRKHPGLEQRIPIDIVGMVLQEQCDGLYPRS